MKPKPPISQREIFEGLARLYRPAVERGDCANAIELSKLMIELCRTERNRAFEARLALRNGSVVAFKDRKVLREALADHDAEPFTVKNPDEEEPSEDAAQ